MKRRILKLLFPFSFVMISITVSAQNNRVSGNVRDANSGNSLLGVTIQVKGTDIGTITDQKGSYVLMVPRGNDTIVFTSIGYISQEIPLHNRVKLNVELVQVSSRLNSIVVIGYGTVKKKDLTGSVSSVSGKDVNAFPEGNIQLALSGRAAGVQVMQNNGAPGAPVSIRIRGTNSIEGNNEPLYVIDGVPTTDPSLINNSDIESIQILKDASATAIYGSRGANGVVIITTKSGKAGPTVVDYESTFAIQMLRKKIPMMDAKQYVTYQNEIATDLGLPPRFSQSVVNSTGKGFDWQNFVFHNALMQNHSLSVRGGNDKTKFAVIGSYFGQDGIIKNSGYQRYSLDNNFDHHISNKLDLKGNIILGYIESQNQNSNQGGRGTSLIAGALDAFPTVTPYDSTGKIRDLRTIYSWNPEVINPAYYFNATSDIVKSNKVIANLSLTYNPITDLSINVLGAIQSADNRENQFTTSEFYTGVNSANIISSNSTSYLSEGIATYNKTIGKNNFQIMAGVTFQNFLNTSVSAGGQGFLSDLLNVYNLQSANTPGIPSSSYSYSVLLSSIGRINYDFDNRILATINFRADGSSVYSTGNKWGYFPSGALAWRISKEKFFHVNSISDLKIRAGWGVTGSQAISPYSTLKTLFSGTTGFGNGVEPYFVRGSTVPVNLKWESTAQTDIGFDLSMFNYRLIVTGDYYIKNTYNLLNPVPLTLSTGYTSSLENIGSVRNSGIELDIDGKIISTQNFKWDISGNIAYNKNIVTKLYGGLDILGTGYNLTLINEPVNIIRVGQPIGAFYGYIETGYDKNGNITYKDVNGDGVINQADKVILGDPNPKIIYGFNTSLSYAGFNLSIFFQGIQGRDIFNLSEVNRTLDVVWGANLLEDVYNNTWTPENTHAKYPKPSNSDVIRPSNRFVENGSYLRLKNIQLAYNFPIRKNKSIKSLQLFIGGVNLLTFTKYSWWDPEVNTEGGGNSFNQGIDYNSYPNYKSVSLGIHATF